MVAVVVILVALVALVVLFTVPFPKGSVSGTVPVAANGSPGQGIGINSYNQSSQGSVDISWHTSSPAAAAVIVVISGTCNLTSGACASSLQSTYVCISSFYTTGSSSGTCQYSGGPGEYTVIVVEVSGFQAADTVDYSGQVSGPLL